jgi:anti-sigma factor RsiW
MIRCRDVPDLADLALDGDGPVRQRVSLAMHLAGCRDCRTYVRGLAATRRLVAAAVRAEGGAASVLGRLAGTGSIRAPKDDAP